MRHFIRSFPVFLPLIFLFSNEVYGGCMEKPQLFLHQRTSVRELVATEPFITLSDVSKEFLTCRSSQNVEWFYEGDGEPSKFQESSSIQINSGVGDDGTLEYCMTSKASIYARQSDTDLAKHTGKYTCQEVGNSSNSVSIFVFVGRRSAPVFLHSRKTITLTLGPENVTDSSFIVPCGTATPNVEASLYRKPSGSSSSYYQLIYPTAEETQNSSLGKISFDPRYGFRIRVPSGQELPSFFGDYKCIGTKGNAKSSRENDNEDFVIYSLVGVPAFRAFPPEYAIFTSTILNFTCESTEEPVLMKEVRVRSLSDYDPYVYDVEGQEISINSNSVEDIEEIEEKNENKVHVANYLEMNPTPGSYGEIQCLAEKDKRVLHSWQYRVLGKKEEKLSGIKFNPRESYFSCRSKSGFPGRLSFVSCRTPSECRINEVCLKKSDSCRGYSNATKALCHRGNNFCGRVFYKGGSGLIRCIGDGIDQIRGFTDEANDLRLRMGFQRLKPSETAFLSLKTEVDTELTEGDEVDVNLKLGYYFFLHPVQWAIRLNNGTSIRVEPKSVDLQKTNKLYRNIFARIPLPIVPSTLEESVIVGIDALIPLRSSVPPSWKTITLPVFVKKSAASSTPLKAEVRNPEEPNFARNDALDHEIEGSGQSDDTGLEMEEVTETITDDSPIEENTSNQPNLITKTETENNEEIEVETATNSDMVEEDFITTTESAMLSGLEPEVQ